MNMLSISSQKRPFDANTINIYPATYHFPLTLPHPCANQQPPVPTPHKIPPGVAAGAGVGVGVGVGVNAMMDVVGKDPCLKHECKQCGEQFNQERSLTQHALVHKLVKNFECHECGRQFLKKSKSDPSSRMPAVPDTDGASHEDSSSPPIVDLRKHTLGHNGLECGQCGKQFANNGNLKRHLLLHTGVKDYKCSDCGKEFTQKAHLDQHALSHSGVKNFKCEECGALFSRKGNLARHKQIHA